MIIFEDEALIVINKPAGMVVNRAESVTEPTVQDWAEKSSKLQATRDKLFLQRSGIAHRLDRETSGALLIAKDPLVLYELMRQFKAREVHKEYLALVHGTLEPQEGWFHVPLKRKGLRLRKFGVMPLGKMSDTTYKVQKTLTFQGNQYSLVALQPLTGRTHQLRVQLSFYHHPIVADGLYASPKMYEADIQWCPRHFLHAQSITFFHPITHHKMTIRAPLAEDLHNVLTLF